MTLSYPHRLIRKLSDLIFPYRCLGCAKYLDHSYICSDCQAKIPIKIRLECVGCRRTSPGGLTCPDCRPNYDLDRIFIVSEYHDPLVADLVKALKYKFIPETAGPMVQLAWTYVQNQSALRRIAFASEDFTVVPVPLHRRRENWRGFNQSILLARGLAERFRLKYCQPLARTDHRAPQAQIEDKDRRFSNVSGSFVCDNQSLVGGKSILLVDDVCTTGATLNECAHVLKQAGAASVTALVIARG